MNIRPNRIKQKLAAGESAYVVGGLRHGDDIDKFGPVGFDGGWLEGEHGPVDFADISDLTRACDLWGLTSIVRVYLNEQAVIYRSLDRGAQGIAVPHVNTKAEAENVVQGGKFAPIGQRGLFVSRQGYGVEDYLEVANDQTLLMVLIEDIVAVQNLDEILSVDHIDVFFVAPSDLAASMGLIGQTSHPEVQKTIDGALERIISAGRVAGHLTSTNTVEKYAEMGVRVLFTIADGWIDAGAKEFRSRAEAATASR